MPGWRFHHIGVAVRDIQAGIRSYQELFGYRLLAGPFEDPIQQVVVCFVGSGAEGDLMVELVAPAATGSPVSRALAKSNSAYHVCYEVEALDRTLAEACGKGCLPVSEPVPAVAFGGRRIAWLYTPTRQLLEVLER